MSGERKQYFFILVFIIGILVFNSAPVSAQYGLTVHAYNPGQEKAIASILKQIKINYTFTDSLSRKRELNNLLIAFYGNGYLAASFDSISVDTTMLTTFLSTGEMYKWVRLSKGNMDEGLLSEIGFREKIYRNKPVNLNSLRKIQDHILTWYENNGYPFSEIRLDSVQAANKDVTASLFLTKGSLVTIDSMVIKGDAKLADIYLYNYLGIKPHSYYNEELITKISTRLKELPMVAETRPFNISFYEDKAIIYLYLADKKASQLDGVIGVQPDNSGSGKINISGDVHIRLHSSFGRGEIFDLNWKQPQPKTQDLKVKFNYPFLFSTPFGIDLNLTIYKKDSTYIELQRNVGIQYLMTGNDYIKAFYTNKTSSLLNTKQYEFVTELPSFADITLNSYGLGFRSEKLDYRLNPRTGYSVEGTASVGRKSIQKNSKLVLIDYDSLDLNSVQYNGEITGDYYLPLFSRGVVDVGTKAAAIIGSDLFQNELYRIGGLKTLRGFDEESILASRYIIGKLEYRYIMEQNSYLFLFFNGAYYERRERGVFIHDVPLGFGAGITFETKLGIFSVTYALGKEFDNPILFRSGKIHFGLINYF